MIQGNRLCMTGLGNATSAELELGVHLRWSVPATDGFPSHGFRIYRAGHTPGGTTSVDLSRGTLAGPAAGPTTFTSHSGTLTVSSTALMTYSAGGGSTPQPYLWAAAATLTVHS